MVSKYGGDDKTGFEWDEAKNLENHRKHGVMFDLAQQAFLDPNRLIAEDVKHSHLENRFYCIGKVGGGVLTVRFAYRGQTIRIFGAGYWRKGKELYEDSKKD